MNATVENIAKYKCFAVLITGHKTNLVNVINHIHLCLVRLFNGIGKSLNYSMRARPESSLVMAWRGQSKDPSAARLVPLSSQESGKQLRFAELFIPDRVLGHKTRYRDDKLVSRT